MNLGVLRIDYVWVLLIPYKILSIDTFFDDNQQN